MLACVGQQDIEDSPDRARRGAGGRLRRLHHDAQRLTLGAVGAAALSTMLVKVLTGVFDPPPDYLSIPWGYLIALVASACIAVALAGAGTLRALRRPTMDELRDL